MGIRTIRAVTGLAVATLALTGCSVEVGREDTKFEVTNQRIECDRPDLPTAVPAGVLPAGFPVPDKVAVARAATSAGTADVVLCPQEGSPDAHRFYKDRLAAAGYGVRDDGGVKLGSVQAQQLTILDADGGERGSVTVGGAGDARFVAIELRSVR